MSSISSFFARSLVILVVISLLSNSAPAAPQTIVGAANDWSTGALFWFNNSGLRKLIQRGPVNAAKKQEKQSDRDAKISQIQIFPGNLTVDLNDRVKFNAIALDANGNTIGG